MQKAIIAKKASRTEGIAKPRMKISNKMKSELPLHLMLLPSVIIIIIFNYIPMLGIVIAFKDYSPVFGIFDSEWCGLKNFAYVFTMPDFKRVMWNTVYIAFMKIVTNMICPITLALMLNEVRSVKFQKGIQTIVYLPHFLSWVILSGILVDILSPSEGVVNKFITMLGGTPIFFLGDAKIFPYTLIITNIWKEIGWQTIIYLAAIISIDPTLYEAAIMDGAGRIRQTFSVTIPGIVPTIILLLVLSLGSVLNAGFDQVFNLYSPQVYSTGDIIDTLVYRLGLVDAQFGPSTAVGLFKSVVALIFVITSYRLADKYAGYRIF